MWQSIALIWFIAFIAAAWVPVVMLTLARLGWFEPIEIKAFGKHLRFAPTDTGSVT